MRTTKRFTPKVLARFVREGRGTGIYQEYIPWHRVSRGDPASRGRSHLLQWQDRLRELLSDGELGAQLFAVMLPDLDDSLEQYRLEQEPSQHPLAAYQDWPAHELFPGTLDIAAKLGIKHPLVSGDGQSADWVPSTDLLLVRRPTGRRRQLMAVSFKSEAAEELTKRTKELLSLEREYWRYRHAVWLLITPAQFDHRVVLTLRRTAAWALDMSVDVQTRALAVSTANGMPNHSLTQILNSLTALVGDHFLAQRALWQSVWRGELPIDLRRGWRPHVPLLQVSPDEFRAFNPIASGRSACF